MTGVMAYESLHQNQHLANDTDDNDSDVDGCREDWATSVFGCLVLRHVLLHLGFELISGFLTLSLFYITCVLNRYTVCGQYIFAIKPYLNKKGMRV